MCKDNLDTNFLQAYIIVSLQFVVNMYTKYGQ